MKTVFSLLVFLISTFALADSNGVERGDIGIAINGQIPAGVEDKIETTIFSNCDLRGATHIATSYLQTTRGDDANVYDIQFLVDFGKDRSVAINVKAELHIGGAPESAIEIAAFNSAICRSIP